MRLRPHSSKNLVAGSFCAFLGCLVLSSAAAAQESRQDRRDAETQRRGQSEGRSPDWIYIAVNADGDDRWERTYAVHRQDLAFALQRSRQRRQQAGREERRGERSAQSVSGTISDKLTVRIGGQQHVLARVETDEGRRAKVWLGPRQRIDELNLQDGDRVTAEGVRVRINDRPILLARRLHAGGETISNELPHGGNLRVVRGQLESKRTRQFPNRDGQYVIARIRTEEGETRTVVLGQPQNLDQLDLQSGDSVTIIGSPTFVDGQPAIDADRIATQTQRVNIAQFRRTEQQDRQRERR